MRSRANLRTVDWKSFSSSLSAVSGGGVAARCSVACMFEAYYKRYYGRMAIGTTLVSEQEYLSTNYKPACDYIDGVLRPKPMATSDHGTIQSSLSIAIARQSPQFVPGSEISVRLRPGKYFVPDLIV